MKKSIFAFIALFLCVFNIPVFAAGVKAKDYEVVHRYVMNDGVIMEICTEAKAPQWFKLAAAHASYQFYKRKLPQIVQHLLFHV